MRIRGAAAVTLMLLVAMAAVAGVRSPAGAPRGVVAAPLAQIEFIRAAIHPGSCLAPEPAAAVRLNPFTRSEPVDGVSSPFLSVTEAPVALIGLLDAPHALLVTLGGDRNAMLACGDLRGEPDALAAGVILREQNASGLAGSALLTAAGETTRISVILDEVRPGIPAAASPTATAPDPSPSPAPGTPAPPVTPAGEPSPTAPPVATPDATPDATGTPEVVPPTGETYTSEQFGYSIVIAPPWQLAAGPTVEPGSDYIAVSNGVSLIDFIGIASEMTAPECLDTIYNYLPTRPGVSLLTAHTGSDAGINLSTPERAIEVWDLISRDAQGQAVATTVYAECRAIQPGAALLVTTHEAPTASYTEQAALREQLYEGLTVP